MTRRAPLFAVALLILAGCWGNGFEIAPVSGQVTLNGKPLPGAAVTFEMITTAKEQGPGSGGVTDAEGRFSLKTVDGHNGAVVGKHSVRISTLKFKDDRSDAAVPSADEILAPELVPEQYRKEPLTFEIPHGGSRSADFTLTGPPPKPITRDQMKAR